MSERILKIAIAQPMCLPGEVALNVERMVPLIHRAGEARADVVVFSECALTGYDRRGVALAAAVPLDHPGITQLQRLADQLSISLIVGTYARGEAGLQNIALLLTPGRPLIIQPKHVLSPGTESGIDRGARQRVLFDLCGLRCAILICADWGAYGIQQELAQQGVEVIFLITAGAGDTSMAFQRHDLSDPAVRARYDHAIAALGPPPELPEMARNLNMSFVLCNQMGYDAARDFFHPGHASVVDRRGETLASLPGSLIVEDLHPDLLTVSLTLPPR